MQIRVLGPLEVRAADGGVADVPGARLRGLLVALALRPGQVIARASLVDWIWGEHPPADAANALQRLVSRLRKTLPEAVVQGQTDGYRLMADGDDVDAVRFERLVADAGRAGRTDVTLRVQLLREAGELWRGDALQDVGLQGGAAFDAAAARLDGLRVTALEELYDAEIGLGHGESVVAELTDLVAAHPVRERLAGALIRALVAAGRDSEALVAFQRIRQALADELGADPSPELAALHVALLRGELGGRREETGRSSNLRAELTTFVGRETDVAAVRELLAEHRLITVIGPGGAGKTRLATETARTLLGELPDGAWLVELAAVGPDGDVAQAALAGLGLRDTLLGDAPHLELTDRLAAAIREREALLILDNCEHVVEAAAVFAHRLLGECRRLRILATSREPLGITGEALWPLEPLELPARDAGPEQIAASPAVRLLRDRARAVRRDLAADAGTTATMVRVCRALDGMPLAIELAAARLRTMPLGQLAHRLDDRFRLLTGGSRTALPRHRTLRAVVDWSWELLSPSERAVLRRLSVFSGGASLDAAEEVCAGADLPPWQVLELLTSLAEKSLLFTETSGAARYRMLGTIKEYAGQKLAEAGEADEIRRAHLAQVTGLAETAEPHLRRAEQLHWLAVLGAEHDNLTAALRGALAAGEAQAAMRLAAAAGWYWWLSGHKSEGMELISAATRVPGHVDDDIRATVYGLMVMFVSSGRGDEHQAAEWIHKAYRHNEQAGHLARRHPLLGFVAPLERMLRTPDDFLSAFEPLLDDEDPWARALARLHLGKMRILLGQSSPVADAYLQTALGEFRALGERFGISFALTELAERIAVRGEFAAACELLEEAITAVGALGAAEDVIRMRSRQAQLYRLLGDEEASAAALAEAERCARRVAWPDALAELAFCRAELARWAGDMTEAIRQVDLAQAVLGAEAGQTSIRALTHDVLGYLADDLGESRAHRAAAVEAASLAGHATLIAQVLVGVADLALRRDRPEQAVRLLAASTRLRGLPDRSHPDAARIERDALDRLGDVRYAEAAGQGAEADWSALAGAALAP
ncbi:BTAD domain-containing putative transcriptional regulator [Streptomyces mangrovisoli]|uniref:AfsR family transcriptional regulator n=1 Tax=Streptomyces mangrovisoli TaxID=1428628 RepID=A0A1J4NS78_9ACTN|nr:BTAD domain-containing putative transcriptional regulator [Streptomyces mangrovisoli]OIJ64444.1 AfsR family transcriptional regulator [Streptomyces mangrovisoli]